MPEENPILESSAALIVKLDKLTDTIYAARAAVATNPDFPMEDKAKLEMHIKHLYTQLDLYHSHIQNILIKTQIDDINEEIRSITEA